MSANSFRKATGDMRYLTLLPFIVLLLSALAASISDSQEAACRFDVYPNSIEFFDISGGSAQIKVTASAPDCRFTVASRYPWITYTSRQEGTEGQVLVTGQGNESLTHRVGDLTIAGHTVNVIQAGPRRGGDAS